jgi:hypothetical protein
MSRSFLGCLVLAALANFALPDRRDCQALSLNGPIGFDFTGDWQCAGTFPGNGRLHRSIYHASLSTDGKWMELTETDLEPSGYVGRYELAVDPGHAKLVFLDINSSGYAIFESPGWDGPILTVTSTDVQRYNTAAPKNRFVYAVKDSQHFDVEWQVEKAGAWASGDLLHCSKDGAGTSASYFVPDVEVGKTYNTVFSRTISFKGERIDEFVRRVAGTASTTVTAVAPDEIRSDDTYRYDGIQEGHGTGERKDSGKTGCFNGKCQRASDGSGTFFNALLWGKPPDTLKAGVVWTVSIGVPWELGPPGEQTVTVLSADPATGTVLLKREGSGEGFFGGDLKEIPVTREGKTYKAAVAPGRSHWIGQTVFHRGIVLSDELMVERPVTLSAGDFGEISATERQFILLNAAP